MKINLLSVKPGRNLGVRRPYLHTKYSEIVRKFGFDGDMEFRYMKGGAGIESSDIPWFRTKQGIYLIKKIKNVTNREEVLYCMDYMRFLMQNGLPIPAVNIKGTDGKSAQDFFVENKREYFGIDKWAHGSDEFSSKASPEVFHNVGRLISYIHHLSQKFSTRYSRPSDYYSLSIAVDTVKNMSVKELAKQDQQYVLSLIESIKEVDFSDIPMNHIPSDLNFGNMKFNASGEPIAIFDWDNSRYGYRVEDVLATVSHSGRRGEGFNLRSSLIEDCIIPFIKGYNREAEANKYDKFTARELKLIYPIYRINFLYRRDLTGRQEFISFQKQIDNIFRGQAWRDFLMKYTNKEQNTIGP